MLGHLSGSYGTFGPELRVSPKPVIAILPALGFVVALGIDAGARSMEQWQLALLASLIFVLSAVAWLLDTWNTDPFPAGTYLLRLTVVDASGNFPPPCQIEIVIQR